ncbi:ATP-binding cassette domain-containing protein [Leucobacter sp. CSA1]|uniref:ATP-binding cassette domain-containing protein n=1 Tax=Leucobacter chromiisoli TaxID=2796471 RepID=A0A934UV00_9MICO|nr:ATP-binding cassette domain-containing protein [Leucobacter chromiisoli]MBK0419360.1 ATP-binding cassette domain-containing protein [Leucobacter chromiisoli]
MTAVIELDGLGKRLGGQTVLDSLALDITGGIFALLGPNGAGKTTLVSILSTLMRPDSGSARILGHDVERDAARVRRHIGTTGQYAAIDEALTGRENLVMIARLLGLGTLDARRRADELLASFDLAETANRPVAEYSGGMRRRVDLAASLVLTPAVLFLDEPTTGLDPASRARLWDAIAARAAEGCCVFMTTQMLDEAEALADRVAILQGGRIVADGTVDRLISLVGTETAVLVDEAGEVRRTLGATGDAGALARQLAGLAEEDHRLHLELRRPTLDDAFLALTGQPGRTAARRDSREVAA